MADVNANIGVNIDTSDALNQLKNLQRQISQFHQSVAKSSSAAAIAQRDLQKNFINGVNAIQGFSAELRTVRTSAESFTNSLEKNKFSIQQYFRYAASQSKTFGKNFTAEFSSIEKTAIERVKTLQTQFIKLGRDANGAMQSIAIRPTALNMKDLGTQTAIAAQKQVLFNQLVKQGSTNLLNFGKNTQWAGRQLMVGFTLPLATLGMTAGRVFMDMEKAAIKFKKVYGDLFTAPEETKKAMDAITELGLAYTKYGVAVSDSLNVAAEAAAAGFQGVDLQNQTAASLKLSILGQMELQKALETTIALQNAFRISSEDLGGEIDFLNAVENQTVVSLDDITTAVPRVATVVQALGGDVRDLAFFLAAMKEGGVNAAQGANALKSGLASLINPTERASQMLMSMGINIRKIVSQNAGDLRGTVIGFARALDTLDPMKRAQAIEQLFGKFQFARISALFDNVIRDGSQASRVLDLAGSSLSELADLSEKELGVSAASAMNRFRASIEQVKVALAPLGELFLEIATPFVDFATNVLKAFNNLPDGIKKIIGTVITVVGGIGPILLMTFGLINNGIANMIKFFATVRLGYLKMTGQAKGIGDETQYMTQEQLEAAAAAASLDQAHAGLTQRFTAEKAAVDALRVAYQDAAAAGARFATLNPGMMKPGAQATKYAKGGVVTVGGRGNKDTEPALLTPGEAVIPAAMVKKYQPLIEGMIAGNIPGYAKGVMLGMPKSAKSVSKNRDAAEQIYEMFLQSSYANTAPTEYGHQISPTTGHSFPIFGLGGVYQKGNKQVFVKPVLDEKAALAEMRSTEISRMAHGLEAPEQKIVVIRDPMDTTRTRRFLALESDLNPKFVNNQPMGLFNEEQYFRQLVASLLRVDKDLSGANVYGNVVADAGPAGVFNRASGLRDYEKNLPSMEDQALINLLGIRGGAKRAFAESTLGLMAGLTPEQYKQRMLGEIQTVLPKLKQTIASFGLTNPTEVGVYDDMVRRLEQGLAVDWSKFHSIHSAVKPAKPKVPKQSPPAPGYKDGIVSVPGPKGAGDVVAAMLAPGEAVIPAEMAKKYAPLIQGMIAGNIPGYAKGTGGAANLGGEPVNIANKASARALEEYYKYLIQLGNTTEAVDKMFAELLSNAKQNSDGLVILTKAQAKQAAEANKEINTKKPQGERNVVLGHLQGVKSVDKKTGERTMGSLTRRVFQDQNVMFSKSGQAIEDFSKDWKAITGGLNESVELGGLELTESVKKTAQLIDDQIHDAAIKLANGGKITDEIIENATNQVLDTAEKAGGEMARVSAALKRVRDELDFEINAAPTSGTRKAAKLQKPDESELQYMRRTVAEGNAKLEGKNFKLTPKGVAAGISSTPEIGRLSSKDEFRSRQRIAKISGNRTYLDNQSKNPSLKGVSVDPEIANRVVKNIQDEVGDKLDKASRAKSPSERIGRATDNIVAGAEETIINSKDDVARATEEMLSPVTKKRTGPRRASSDPAVMAALEGNQEVIQESRRPRRATRPADSTAPTEKIWDESTKNVSGFSNKISQAAFGLSSLTGILSIFGADLGGIMPVISAVTGGLFGLIEVSRLLHGTKLAEIASTRLLTAAQTQGAVGNVASAVATGNVTNMFKTMFVKGKGLAGFFVNMGKVIKSVAKAFGLIGLAIAALSVGIPMILDALKKHEQKVSGLGDAAFVAGEKLKAIANVIGFEPTRDPKTSVGQAADFTGATDEVVSGAIDVRQSESFKALIADGGAYKEDLDALKNASVADAQVALNTLITQLIATAPKDFDPAKIQQFAAAIATEAGKTDLDLSLGVSLNPFEAGNADKVIAMASSMAQNILDEQAVDLTQVQTHTAMFGVAITQFRGMNTELTAAANNQAASISAFYEQLKTGLINGVLTAEEYATKTEELLSTISSFPEVYGMEVLSQMLQGVGIDPAQVNNIKNLNDKLLVTNALLTKGATINKEDIDAIASGDKDKAAKARLNIEREVAKANKITADSVKKIAEAEEARANAMLATELSAYLENAAQEAALKAELEFLGYSAADAQLILNNEMLKGSFLAHQAAGSLSEYNAQLAQFKQIEAQKVSSSGGGGQKSAFQEAIDSLRDQQKEAKSSIMAYAKLRSAGFSVAEASTIAKDSLLSAALAAEKVGSKRWKELVAAIKAAREEEEAWLQSTPEGRAEHFAGVYSKVMDVFSAQEAIIDMNNEAATASTRKLIESLEKQIEVYQRRSAELERDLSKIADKEEEINKKYDEKNKALETVKKLNQDILNQQKSQISIADALSQGDISAAAMAVEDSKAQFAASQGDATQRGLDASRQAELNSLTENGKTRAEIEAEIKRIKQEIETIEFGALQNARDFVEAADEIAEAAKENLRVQGLSKTEWENINKKIDASKANAALYEDEVLKALKNAENLVGEWEKLDETYTTTHVVNTIFTSSGGSGANSGGGDPLDSNIDSPISQANRVRKALNSATHATKVSSALAKAAGATGGPADYRESKINNYLSKITKAQADAIFKASGVTGFALGGPVSGSGTETSDSIPAMLSDGEYVVKAAAAKKLGRGFLDSVNAGRPPQGIPGSMIGRPKIPKPVFNMPERKMVPENFFQPVYELPEKNYSPVGGATPINKQPGNESSSAAPSNSVYNYNLSVNVSGTNASANDIANVVMNKIKMIDSQQVRKQVLR